MRHCPNPIYSALLCCLPVGASGAAGGGGGAPGGAGHRKLRFAAAGGGGGLRGPGSPGDRRRRGCGGVVVAGAGAALVGTAWAIDTGLNAASQMMCWGAATGGGTDSDASRPSMTTDVQTLNGMQESGAVDHWFIQEQRRASRCPRSVSGIEICVLITSVVSSSVAEVLNMRSNHEACS